MRIGGGQAEDIGGELHGGLALATAARHADLLDGDVRAFTGAFRAFTQRVGQAFQDRAVHVGARVHVAKTDDGAFGFGAGHFQTR